MIDFFSKVLGFFETILEYLFNVVGNLSEGFEILSKALIFPIYLSGFLPTILGSAMLICIAVGVVKFILGR